MSTSVMWTLGHMHHEKDLHWLECESDGKKWFPPHLAMYKSSWWGTRQQLTLKLAKMTNGKMVYRFQNHIKYVQSDFLLLNFLHFLDGQSFEYVPLNWSLHILSFTLQKLRDTSMGFVCGFNYHLVLASMPKPIFPHQVHIQKRWLVKFWISMDWNNGVHPMLWIVNEITL
jgi:hypothetical protein